MNEKDKIDEIIDRCIEIAKPHSQNQIVYFRQTDENGVDEYFEDHAHINAYTMKYALKREINNYLAIKEAEINNKLTQVKCEAYELALTHSRPFERINWVKNEE